MSQIPHLRTLLVMLIAGSAAFSCIGDLMAVYGSQVGRILLYLIKCLTIGLIRSCLSWQRLLWYHLNVSRTTPM